MRYRLLRGPAVRIGVTPLVNCREHNILRAGPGIVTHTSPRPGGIRVHFDHAEVALDLTVDQGDTDGNDGWWVGFRHAVTEGGRDGESATLEAEIERSASCW